MTDPTRRNVTDLTLVEASENVAYALESMSRTAKTEGKAADYALLARTLRKALRREQEDRDAIRAELDALKDALPKTADGEAVVVGLKVWKCDAIDPEEDITESDISVETVAGIHRDWVSMKGEWPEERTSVDEIYRRHPVTGKTPEES